MLGPSLETWCVVEESDLIGSGLEGPAVVPLPDALEHLFRLELKPGWFAISRVTSTQVLGASP